MTLEMSDGFYSKLHEGIVDFFSDTVSTLREIVYNEVVYLFFSSKTLAFPIFFVLP